MCNQAIQLVTRKKEKLDTLKKTDERIEEMEEEKNSYRHILKAEGGKNMTMVKNRVVVLAQRACIFISSGGSSDGGYHGAS
jgi:hypothetical protein